MRRFGVIALSLACVAALVAVMFGKVLWGGEQFGYRDSAHFYYPLYERVEQEWNAGRIPLWEPEENAGMPLLGNPTAAVLYPGKVIYRVLPYAWGARIYVIAHVLLAAVAMFVLARHWDVSPVGSSLAAISYAFGMPVAFQYCNVIFLVGAAWTPLGIRAVDRLLRLGNRFALVELAIVLAMQTLGGDPEAAYVIGLCAGGYAVGLACFKSRDRLPSAKRVVAVSVVVLILWVAMIFAAAYFLPGWYTGQGMDPKLPPGTKLPPPSPGWIPASWFPDRPGWTWVLTPWLIRKVMTGLWGIAAVVLLLRKKRGTRETTMLRLCTVLLASAGIAALLIGAQMLPVMEFTGLTVRGSNDGPHTIFPFSAAPYRVAEFFWPYLYGRNFGVNQSWLSFIPPFWNGKFWMPSLYVGGLTILLGLGGFRLRRAPSWQIWISAVGLASLLLSFGECAGPLWMARSIPAISHTVGPLDSVLMGEMRTDGYLIDATGSPYWLASLALPGFYSFRYPSKLLVFTSLALSILAGVGWDELTKRGCRRVTRLSLLVVILSALSLTAVLLTRNTILWIWSISPAAKAPSSFGEFQAKGALFDIESSLLQGGLIALFVWMLPRLAAKRPDWAGAAALVVMAVDLCLVMGGAVVTVPQSLFENSPEVLQVIQREESKDPSSGPYRIHRVPMWTPTVWREEASQERIAEFVRWERATIQPKYAIPYGVEYTLTQGTAELFDYEFFFAAFYGNHTEEFAKILGLKPKEKVVYFPRRGFDLWNTRYFVLPFTPSNDESRGIASFLPGAKRIYPVEQTKDELATWARNDDWQILKNNQAYPRAWIVHEGRWITPIRGMNKADRRPWMEQILYQADALWNSPGRILYDPRRLAWIETDDRSSVQPFLPGGEPQPGEIVKVRSYDPQRVELEASLERPGVVVLADVFYPGWRLTVDGEEATIVRVNRCMRGALVQAGTHKLTYTYRPRSFRIGLILSGLGGILLLGSAVWSWRRPGMRILEA